MSALTVLEREGELALLRDALTQAQQGRGRVVVAEAPAGLAKTSLLRAPAEDNQRRADSRIARTKQEPARARSARSEIVRSRRLVGVGADDRMHPGSGRRSARATDLVLIARGSGRAGVLGRDRG
jgi:predicted ATPase